MKTESEYYILSAKHTQKREPYLTWWGADCRGYTWFKSRMGVYSEGEAKEIATNQDNYMVPKILVDNYFIKDISEGREGFAIPNLPIVLKALGFKTVRANRSGVFIQAI
ncbi:MAG: hypothetical protein V4714_10810 [Bacteroidota bacterium]